MLKKIKYYHVIMTVIFLSIYHDSVVILRFNYAGLVVKEVNTWFPYFMSKSELLEEDQPTTK